MVILPVRFIHLTLALYLISSLFLLFLSSHIIFHIFRFLCFKLFLDTIYFLSLFILSPYLFLHRNFYPPILPLTTTTTGMQLKVKILWHKGIRQNPKMSQSANSLLFMNEISSKVYMENCVVPPNNPQSNCGVICVWFVSILSRAGGYC
jgi:hypothetical protein